MTYNQINQTPKDIIKEMPSKTLCESMLSAFKIGKSQVSFQTHDHNFALRVN